MALHIKRRTGFTLIELLVVVALISVLVGLIAPSLSQARATGLGAKCLGNLHGIGVALQSYFNVNDDHFPLSQAHGGYQPGTAWLDTLMPHTDGKIQYRCPADTAKNFHSVAPAQRRVTSYGINIFTGPLQIDWAPQNIMSIPPFGHQVVTRIHDSSRLIFVGELAELNASGQPIYPDHFHPEAWTSNPPCQSTAGCVDPQYDLAIWRHLRKSNYLHADCHAARMDFGATWRVSADGSTLLVNQYDPEFPHGPNGWYEPPN